MSRETAENTLEKTDSEAISLCEYARDMGADAEAGGQARTLHPEEIDKTGKAMRALIRNTKIGGAAVGTSDLWADAGIGRDQAVVRQGREIATYCFIEAVGAVRIDVIIYVIDPLLIRPEADLPGHIQGDMRAEAGRFRHRIDKVREGRSFRHGKIAAFDDLPLWDVIR